MHVKAEECARKSKGLCFTSVLENFVREVDAQRAIL